ncbi:MAG: SRPBCC family protein [Minwuia sp.]|nr:SRPBCC family protein [Minwuia sp.]
MTKPEPLILFDHVIATPTPAEAVFAFVSNHQNYALWFPGVIGIRSDDSLPHGTVGKTYRETIRLPSGREKCIAIPVVESVPPARFVTEGRFPPLHPRMEMTLAPGGDGGTTLRWRFMSRNRSRLGRLLISLVIRPALRKRSRIAAQRLSAHLSALPDG